MSELLGAVGGGAIGLAVGEAGATVLEPALEATKQEAWKNSKARILELGELATLVAQALNAVEDVLDDANRNGYDEDQLRSAIQLALKAPGFPEAEKLYLRGLNGYKGAATLNQLHHAYAKAGLEGQWWDQLTIAAQNQLLTPAELALAAVRSTVNDQGLLVVKLDTAGSNVKQYPVASLNIIDEAATFGIDSERLRVMIGAVGLPMAVELAARATFRNILTKGAYYQAVEEGDTRPEWADSIFEVARQIPTAEQFLENYLRGYTSDFQTALNNAALHGMSNADAQLVFENMGRPLSIHSIQKGLAHGVAFNPIPNEIQDPFEASAHESNIKPSYYDLAIAAEQYTWPPYFVLKNLVPDPFSVAEATDFLRYEGYRDDVAAAIAQSFAGGTATANKHVTSSQTSLVTAARKAYVGQAANEQQARTALTAASVDVPIQDQLVALWDAQRTLEALPPPTV